MSFSNHRRSHKKQISALRLSSDTTTTLPEYITVGWGRETEFRSQGAHDLPFDKPPDYPDSAEEADEDTDSESNSPSVYVPHLPPPKPPVLTPGRHRRQPSHNYSHKRKRSVASTSGNDPVDPFLDSLLARSVHALEMSNTLLQSSISTKSRLSAVLDSDSPEDSPLETSARGLSMRIHRNNVHDSWVDNLEELRKGVEGLFADEPERHPGSSRGLNGRAHTGKNGISSSLPTTSPLSQGRRNKRRPSLLDLREASKHRVPHLQLSSSDHSDFVSPAPRALTPHSASTADSNSIALPSTHCTLGLCASPSLHSLHGSPSSPKITDRPLEPTTLAYNMLSSFVYRSPSPASSVSSSLSAIPSLLSSRRNSRNGSTSIERITKNSHHSPSRMVHKSSDCNRISSDSSTICRASRSQTPKQIISTLPRSMTPPTEESSSEGVPAKRTIQSLRKILDEQPPPQPPRLRPPAFLPRTPAPVAESSTSTATASVSRLFTKSKHSSSTRPPSPPPHSAMKQSTPNGHSRTPSNLSLAPPMKPASASAPSSGRSTPKRISFAKLPESYAESRPSGSFSKFRDRDKKRRAGRSGEDRLGREEASGSGWWMGWLVTHGPLSSLRQEERMEDRLSRSWSGRMGGGFGPTMEDWAI